MKKIYFGNDTWLQAAAFSLRYEVFVLEQQIDPILEFDSLDTPQRNYLVLFDDDLPIATLRYQQDDDKTIHPDRFCVKKSYRQQGIGQELLLHYEQLAIAEGFSKSRLSAEETALSFYQNLGYRQISPRYLEDGIWCVAMEKYLEEKNV